MTQVGVVPIQVHDAPLCRLLCETAPVLRAGDIFLEDRGLIDGETITLLKQQRHVDVIVPLKANMLSYKDRSINYRRMLRESTIVPFW